MATQKLSISPPSLLFTTVDENNNFPIVFPAIPFARVDLSKNQVLAALVIPSAVYAGWDPVNNTTSGGFTSILTFDAREGFIVAAAYAISLTARAKDSPSANLLANVVRLLAGGTEIARITIDATTQVCGAHLSYGAKGDSRFVLSGAATAISGGAVEADDEKYTKNGHGLLTGAPVTLTSLTGGTGLTADTLYFFHRLDANTGYLCSTYANALAGTPVAVSLDASSVVLTPQTDIGFVLDQIDPNLLIDLRVLASDE